MADRLWLLRQTVTLPDDLDIYLAWLDTLPPWKRFLVLRTPLWRLFVDDFRDWAA